MSGFLQWGGVWSRKVGLSLTLINNLFVNHSGLIWREKEESSTCLVRIIDRNIHIEIWVPAVVVFSFFFCWSPFHSQRLMFVLVTLYGRWSKTLVTAQHILFMISGKLLSVWKILLIFSNNWTLAKLQDQETIWTSSNSNESNSRSILLPQLCHKPGTIFTDVKEVPTWVQWHEAELAWQDVSSAIIMERRFQ